MKRIERTEIKIDQVLYGKDIKKALKGQLESFSAKFKNNLSNGYSIEIHLYIDEVTKNKPFEIKISIKNNKDNEIYKEYFRCVEEKSIYNLFNIEFEENKKLKNLYIQIIKYEDASEGYCLRERYLYNKRHSSVSNDYLYDLLAYSDFINKDDLYYFCSGAILNSNCVKHLTFARNTLAKLYYSNYGFHENVVLTEEQVIERLNNIIKEASFEFLKDNLIPLLVEYVELLCLITVDFIAFDYSKLPEKKETEEFLKDIYNKMLKSFIK